MIKLFITDLDDTLYSWIGFFIPSFYGMAEELSRILGMNIEDLLDEYKLVHQEKGNVEYPYSTLCLPSVLAAYPGVSAEELRQILNPAFHQFNSIRKKTLKLYPHVVEALNTISNMGIKIVGYTESAEENGFYRLKKLGIDQFFHRVYVSDSQYVRPEYIPSSDRTSIVSGKKPNPNLLKQICEQENVTVNEALYAGDSLTKDIYMAKTAGVTSVLCRYPGDEQKTAELYQKLVAISHWTEADFEREKEIKALCQAKNILPDYTIDSFADLPKIIQIISSKIMLENND